MNIYVHIHTHTYIHTYIYKHKSQYLIKHDKIMTNFKFILFSAALVAVHQRKTVQWVTMVTKLVRMLKQTVRLVIWYPLQE